jgi:hypothetical protein
MRPARPELGSRGFILSSGNDRSRFEASIAAAEAQAASLKSQEILLDEEMAEVKRNFAILRQQVADKQGSTIKAGTAAGWSSGDWESASRQFRSLVDTNTTKAVDMINILRSDVCLPEKRKICERMQNCYRPCERISYTSYCPTQPGDACPAPCTAERRFFIGPKQCIFKGTEPLNPPMCSYSPDMIPHLSKYRPPTGYPASFGPTCPTIRKY